MIAEGKRKMSDIQTVSNIIQIGTVTILRDRKYEEVVVPSGTYPVYLDQGSIYWEMEGYRSKWEGEARLERLWPGSFKVYPARGDVIIDTTPVKVCSAKKSIDDFDLFIQTDVLCRRGPERRLVFTFLAYPDSKNNLSELTHRLSESASVGDQG